MSIAVALCVAAAATGVSSCATSPAASGDSVVVSLPSPTGPNTVGVTELHLTDPHRTDPWTGATREVLVQIWYPAQSIGGAAATAWMPPAGRSEQEAYLDSLGVPEARWTLGPSHSYPNRPALAGNKRFPVLLNSPGMGDATGWSTAQAEDLASHGYVVAAINHTHEAYAVHFPDGRVERTVVPLNSPQEVLRDLLVPTRVADTRFVLDELAAVSADRESATAARLPDGLAERLDLTDVGMFGHSLGGSTTVQSLHDDPRIRAGVNLDGPILGSVATEGAVQPLLMLASGTSPWYGNPGWEPDWSNNSGVKIPLRVAGTEHMSFSDQQTILPQLTTAGLLPAATTTKAVGVIDPQQSIDLQRTYLRTFFDSVFGRGNSGVIEAINSLDQPEVAGPR
ncbi:alpha/beta hydrolase family protein [Nocardia salmonicida]|uniref:alpha/beta hydrolase family protein n=1 Tax=Nocardia salmonicida TaxID=53431 RepID=UPI0036887564